MLLCDVNDERNLCFDGVHLNEDGYDVFLKMVAVVKVQNSVVVLMV